ncbi:hypothetical protein M9H77_31916 [Catharanthus roseus]|uniref:Uncharacterized protein n=1 Tax=Catharanthus roseus TaxID=4058 RepID=A0ACC0A1S9_CATRO|nr:hypothetical protein M9H77_31916 [Catharanthus roseus]
MNCFVKLHNHYFKKIITAYTHTRGLTERLRSCFSISCFLLRLTQDDYLIFLLHNTYNLVPRGMHIPYSAVVDLVVRLGVSQKMFLSKSYSE